LRDFIRRQGGGGGVLDGQLLERFLKERDETAFEVLVWRHGPMVLALGRRVLGNNHDAEDVLQATFLTLVRKAGSIGKCESLSSWLYKVAYRIALRSQVRAAKRVADGRLVEDVPAPEAADESVWRELRPLLDAAIERLPEKYRTAIVLCDLQGKTHREAAEQLGCAVGTISTRVLRARQLLRKRLAHHGLSVSIGILSAALAQRTAAAMPASLTAATVRAAARLASDGTATGIVSASIAELIEGASQTMLMYRFKIVMLLALAAGAAAVGAGVMARRELSPPPEEPPAAAKAPADKPAETVTVRGRVLGPDDKPIKDARLFYPHLRTAQPRSEEDIEYPQRGKTDAEGRFRFEMPRTEVRAEFRMQLIAVADGYGADWTALTADNLSAELMLRLVKDQRIEGRILSTEGKPLPGIRVGITTLAATAEGKLDPFLTAWKREWQNAFGQTPKRLFVPMSMALPSATTDKDGRFRLGGIGVERVAQLQVRGPGISQGSLHVIGRDGFDAAEINKAVVDRTPIEVRRLRQRPMLHGPKFTYVAESARRIEGRVLEVGSGKPVAGYMIHCGAGYNNGRQTVSDKEGRYQLNGLPKMEQYLLTAWPPAGSAWLRAGARVPDREGLQPIAVDFTVARGIVVSGRILDRATGKGVRGNIRFVPLAGNTFAGKPGYDSYRYEGLVDDVGVDGRFKLAVMPGPCALMVHAGGGEKANGGLELNPYKQAEFDAKDREYVKITPTDSGRYFSIADNRLEFLTYLNAVKVIDLAPDAGTAKCDIFLERGATQTIRIEDADGKPLTGTTIAGITAAGWGTDAIKDARCTVFALDPKKPRRLLFFHAQRKLAGTLTVRGDEKEAPVAHLGQTGSAIGRLLDRDGQPLAGADINLSSSDRDAREFYRQLLQSRQAIRTGKDGRFRIEGIVPEVKFTLDIMQGRTYFIGEPRIGARQVKPGETLDLGDVRVKPGP
jgi:RNA polymerase sigma factor (sigma-70 family)